MSAAAGHHVAGQDTDRQKEEDFLKACKYGDVASVKALIDANVNVNASDSLGRSALECAVSGGHLKIVNSLIEAGADINRYYDDDMVGAKVLVAAAKYGHLHCLTSLIRAGVDVTQKDKDGVTVGGKAVVKAAFKGNSGFIRVLIQAGVDVNQKDKDGVPAGGKALVEAAVYSNNDLAKALIETGLDVNQKDKDGVPVGGKALVEAAVYSNNDLAKALIETGLDVNQKDKDGVPVGGKALVEAAVYSNNDLAKALIETGLDVNQKDKDGVPVGGKALVEAAVYRNNDLAKALIETGLDVNQKDKDGVPVGGKALVEAAVYRNNDLAKALIETGLDVNQKDKDGVPVGGKALVEAAVYSNNDLAKALIETGLDVNQKGKNRITVGGTALLVAACNGNSVFVKVLIEAGLDVNQKDKDGVTLGGTALVEAVVNGSDGFVNALIEAGVDVNQKDKSGVPVGGKALMHATIYRSNDLANALIEAGLDVNQKDEDGVTIGGKVLVKASVRGNDELVYALVKAGVDVNQKDTHVNTVGGKALVRAACGGHIGYVDALISVGVDLNVKLPDEYGSTVGGYALGCTSEGINFWPEINDIPTVVDRCPECINTLILSGVNINKNLSDKYGGTVGGYALGRAAKGWYGENIKTLIQNGVNVNRKLSDEYGGTVGGYALGRAAEGLNGENIKTLIQNGVDVNRKLSDKYGGTVGGYAFGRAAKGWYGENIKTLIQNGVHASRKLSDEYGGTVGGYALGRAAEGLNGENIKTLIQNGVDVNRKLSDEYGGTVGGYALGRAAEGLNGKNIKTLIQKGVDVNRKLSDEYGGTVGGYALGRAAEGLNGKNIKTLIQKGVDVNRKLSDKYGGTVGGYALGRAAKGWYGENMKMLIQNGVNVNRKLSDEYGGTVGGYALGRAAEGLNGENIKTLIQNGVDVNRKLSDEYGGTVGGYALGRAAEGLNGENIKTLIQNGVDVNRKLSDEYGGTVGGYALGRAAEGLNGENIKTLIQNGVDVNRKLSDEYDGTVGGYALGHAAEYGRTENIEILLQHGIDVNRNLQIGTVGERALLKLLQCDRLQHGHHEIVGIFVEYGVDIHKQNTFIKICERKIKELQEQSDLANTQTIALRYKLYSIISGKTKEAVIDAMTRDMTQIKDQSLKSKYQTAIDVFTFDRFHRPSEVKLDEQQKMQLMEAFASGTERDNCVRSNFVGLTGAGKTSLMWQLFLILFTTSDIDSTNGIDISLGYCDIDLRTREWKRHEESDDIKFARRIQTVVDANKVRNREKKSKNENINTGSGRHQTAHGDQKQQEQDKQQQQQQQQQRNDNLKLQSKVESERESTDVEVIYTKSAGTAKPMLIQPDSHLLQRMTQPISKAGRRVQQANAMGIDYAGQSTYYALHQLFLAKRGVNIIALDGSKDFDEYIVDEEVRHIGSKEKANSKDFFRFWANSLRYYLPERKNEHIITVFTHKDVMNPNDYLEKKDIVKEIIEEIGMTGLFFRDVLCINANDPNDEDLQKLRSIILGFSEQEKHWGQEMPSSWLLLEDKLMQKKAGGTQVMTLDEIDEIHLKSVLPLDSRDELLLFLTIHNEIGTFLYFAVEGITNIVFLNPQWLIDSLKLLICARNFRDDQYVKQWDRLHEKGVVDKEFLYNVWKSHTQERFYEFREYLILLMNKLDLISSPKNHNEKGDYAQSPYFIVPCMLNSAPANFLQKYVNKATYKNLPLTFEFKYGFLPTATAYRMLATCVMEFGELKEEATIYCDAAVFRVYEHHYMTLEFTSSSIIANVLTFGKTCTNLGVCKGIREFLDDTLKCILSSQGISTNYSLLVACRKEGSGKLAWLKWSSVIEEPEIICDQHKDEPPHVVKTEELFKHWSPVRSDELGEPSKWHNVHKQPDPNEKPSHFHLGRISRRIPAKEFHHLFTELGLSQNYIDKIKTEHTSTKQSIFVLLMEWTRYPGSTYKQLADALYEKQRYVLDIEEIQTRHCGWRGGRQAILVRNNIQLEQVDVIACAIDSSLNFETSGKTARDLLTFGGKTLQRECKERFPSGIKFKDVIAINGGELKCKKVYLTSLPDGEIEDEKSHKETNKQSEKLSKSENDKVIALRTAISEMLNKAAKEQMKSIALPAIGTSKLGLAPDKVANIMYGCIKRLPKGPLSDIRFVLNDKATYKAFEKEHLLVKDILDTFLNKNVEDSTDLELDRVCIMTGSSYLELGIELGLTKPEVDVLKKDYRKCLSITREVIKLWINKNRPNATWEVLGDALYEIGADMDFITSMYTESRETS